MAIKKRSFFERLSGSNPGDDYDPFEEDYLPANSSRRVPMPSSNASVNVNAMYNSMPMQTTPTTHNNFFEEEEQVDGQLPVDVYQTPSEIVIRTFIAGVRPDEINVSISRDSVSIEGTREERSSVAEGDYIHYELFWGSFSRTIPLPTEIDVENSSAGAKDGLLTIILPKLDKARQTKLRVKSA